MAKGEVDYDPHELERLDKRVSNRGDCWCYSYSQQCVLASGHIHEALEGTFTYCLSFCRRGSESVFVASTFHDKGEER